MASSSGGGRSQRKRSDSSGGINDLRNELASWADCLQRRHQTAEAARERLQRDLRERRRALDGAFRWLDDIVAAQRRQQVEEVDQLERSCRRLLDRRAAELRANRDAIVARLAAGSYEEDQPDLLRLRDAAVAVLEAEQPGGEAESLAQVAAEQLRLRQHRWQTEFETWLKSMPAGLLQGSLQGSQQGARDGRRNSAVASSDPESHYSVPGCNSPNARSAAAAASTISHRPSASLPSERSSAPKAFSFLASADSAARYWSPDAESDDSNFRRRVSPIGRQDQPQFQIQQPKQQSNHQQLQTTGCPVSIAYAGPPENLLYVAEEFEDDLPNRVNVYNAQGRLVGPFNFSLGQDGRALNPYRLAWCPQSQRLLLLSYESRQCMRPYLVDRRGRPSEPFTSATRSLNLAGLEPMDIATADPPGLAFLCCPSRGIVMLDLCGRQSDCQQLGIGAPVAAAWSGITQQLAVLHSQVQPDFRLSLLSLTDGPSLRLVATCTVDFESIDPPLVIWDGPRVLVLKVADEASGCMDIYAAALGSQPVVEATRLLWQGGGRRNPIHCCLRMHEGQRHLCICDRNHPAVLICLV